MGKRLRHNLVYAAVRLARTIVDVMPRRAALMLGETLGIAAGFLLKGEYHKAQLNLQRAFGPELSPRRRNAIARRCFITLGRSAVEMMRMRRHYHRQIRSRITVIGEEHLRQAYERGRGVVVFTGHVGNFELLAAYVAQCGYKTAVIGRSLSDERLDRLLVAGREAMGIVNIRSDASPRLILRYLKEGYVIGILIDTDSFRVGGELTSFFGRPAKTPTGPTQLGLIAGAAFLPIFCLSLPGGDYRIVMGHELEVASGERTRENVYRLTYRMTRIIEEIIRAHPEQWIWMHNRWHTRPEEDDLKFLSSLGWHMGRK